MNAMNSAGAFIVHFVFGMLMFIVVLRLLLQLARANFYNPICQQIYKVTNPVLIPVSRVLPTIGGFNTASAVLLWVLAWLQVQIVAWLSDAPIGLLIGLLSATVIAISMVLEVLFWAIIIRIVLSFLAANAQNPLVPLLYRITDMVLKPFQRILPVMGGIDFSPMLAILFIGLLQRVLLPALMQLAL